jgi:hypothetical protein
MACLDGTYDTQFIQMAQDQLVANVFCFGSWELADNKSNCSSETLDWCEVAAGAAHVAACVHWAQHAQAHQTSSTARKVLFHALAAADAAGM